MKTAAKVYIGITALVGLAGLAYALSSLPQPDKIWILVALVLLCAVAQATAVPLFAGSSISVALAISFISLLLLGPAAAIITNLGSAAVHALYPKRRPWYKIVFNTGLFTISAGAAGAIFWLCGGVWPIGDLAWSAIAFIAAALIYFVVNTLMLSLAISLASGQNFRKVFNENHRWLVFHYLTAGMISLVAAMGYRSMGWTGLLIFSIPLIMPWLSTRMYVAKTKALMARDAELLLLKQRLAETQSKVLVPETTQ
ncbi:MAG: hypothetical protein HY675_22350 [Chloroflexi bacterium]|nr:hypothetical protein [Chloroflexota bacterium]